MPVKIARFGNERQRDLARDGTVGLSQLRGGRRAAASHQPGPAVLSSVASYGQHDRISLRPRALCQYGAVR
jgi:hypothetical protein